MGWRIIYLEQDQRCTLYLDNLKVSLAGKDILVPLSDIGALVIDNQQAMFSSRLLARCAEENISVYVCDHRHTPRGIILSLAGNYQSARILESQIHWTEIQKGTMWQIIVRQKILAQAKALTSVTHAEKSVIERLFQLASVVAINDVKNCEGFAAKLYFRSLFGPDFFRGGEDVINAALNYGYAILRAQLARTLVARGLTPQLGIFHRGTTNPFNLADDLIEPLRPIIDLWIYQNIERGALFTREHRLALVALLTKKVLYERKKITIFTAIEKLVDAFWGEMNHALPTHLAYPDVQIYD